MFPFRKILTNFFDNKKKFLFEEKINEILNFVEKEGFYPEIRILDKNEPETFVNGKKVLLFCSLNYLNLANHPKVKEAAIRAIKRYGVGAGGSRFVSGNFEIHNILEKKIAEFKREEAGLILHTGYVANVGIIPVLMNFPEIGNFSFFEKK
jgi:glycine C-acetyltransferase